jgi:uncharacterized protein (TIGR00725 family)
LPQRIIVGVIGSGEDARDEDLRLAAELGEGIAREGWVLLTGGRPVGVMQSAIHGAKRIAGSLTIGILPSSDGPAAGGTDIVIRTGLGEARNIINVLSSDLLIACGRWNAGTLSEVAFAIKTSKPLILLDPSPEAILFVPTIARNAIVVSSTDDAIEQARCLIEKLS